MVWVSCFPSLEYIGQSKKCARGSAFRSGIVVLGVGSKRNRSNSAYIYSMAVSQSQE